MHREFECLVTEDSQDLITTASSDMLDITS